MKLVTGGHESRFVRILKRSFSLSRCPRAGSGVSAAALTDSYLSVLFLQVLSHKGAQCFSAFVGNVKTLLTSYKPQTHVEPKEYLPSDSLRFTDLSDKFCGANRILAAIPVIPTCCIGLSQV